MTVIEHLPVREYLMRIIGDEGIKVVENIPEEEKTDEEIAGMSEINLSIVRKTLFTLYENTLVEYRRERNEDSGWLTYLWKANLGNIDRLMDSETRKLLKNLKSRLGFERDNIFYACKCGRLVFDEAAKTGFRCPTCKAALNYDDNSSLIKAIERRVSLLEANLGRVP
jgi:transcription initiation factor TFIIE subunit alpha